MDYTRKFVNWDAPKLDALKGCKAYQLRQRLNDDGKLNRSEKNWLTQAMHSNSYGRRCVCVMGWMFDFNDIVHLYWVCQAGQISEYYAMDKTSLKTILFGKIENIVELI